MAHIAAVHGSIGHLIEQYGTWGVFAVTTVEGEFGPLIGGSLAKLGKLSLISLLIACWAGATLSTTFFFTLGRTQREGRLVQRVTDKRAFSLALRWIDRHPHLFCFFYRFVYGFRIVGPVTISLSQVRWQTFVIINTISSLIWAGLALAVGWYLGPGAARMIAYYFTERPYLVASVISLILLVVIISWRARASARRAQPTQQVSPISPASTAD
jgi:membrane protein DedA with SNARE-associated domain